MSTNRLITIHGDGNSDHDEHYTTSDQNSSPKAGAASKAPRRNKHQSHLTDYASSHEDLPNGWNLDSSTLKQRGKNASFSQPSQPHHHHSREAHLTTTMPLGNPPPHIPAQPHDTTYIAPLDLSQQHPFPHVIRPPGALTSHRSSHQAGSSSPAFVPYPIGPTPSFQPQSGQLSGAFGPPPLYQNRSQTRLRSTSSVSGIDPKSSVVEALDDTNFQCYDQKSPSHIRQQSVLDLLKSWGSTFFKLCMARSELQRRSFSSGGSTMGKTRSVVLPIVGAMFYTAAACVFVYYASVVGFGNITTCIFSLICLVTYHIYGQSEQAKHVWNTKDIDDDFLFVVEDDDDNDDVRVAETDTALPFQDCRCGTIAEPHAPSDPCHDDDEHHPLHQIHDQDSERQFPPDLDLNRRSGPKIVITGDDTSEITRAPTPVLIPIHATSPKHDDGADTIIPNDNKKNLDDDDNEPIQRTMTSPRPPFPEHKPTPKPEQYIPFHQRPRIEQALPTSTPILSTTSGLDTRPTPPFVFKPRQAVPIETIRITKNAMLERTLDIIHVAILYCTPFGTGIFMSLPILSALVLGLWHFLTVLIIVIQIYYYFQYLGDAHLSGDMASRWVRHHSHPLWQSVFRYFNVKVMAYEPDEMVFAREQSMDALYYMRNLHLNDELLQKLITNAHLLAGPQTARRGASRNDDTKVKPITDLTYDNTANTTATVVGASPDTSVCVIDRSFTHTNPTSTFTQPMGTPLQAGVTSPLHRTPQLLTSGENNINAAAVFAPSSTHQQVETSTARPTAPPGHSTPPFQPKDSSNLDLLTSPPPKPKSTRPTEPEKRKPGSRRHEKIPPTPNLGDFYTHEDLQLSIPYLYYLVGSQRYKYLTNIVMKNPTHKFTQADLTFSHPDLIIQNPNVTLNQLPPISLINHVQSTTHMWLPTMATSFFFTQAPHGIYPLSAFFSHKTPTFEKLFENRVKREYFRDFDRLQFRTNIFPDFYGNPQPLFSRYECIPFYSPTQLQLGRAKHERDFCPLTPTTTTTTTNAQIGNCMDSIDETTAMVAVDTSTGAPLPKNNSTLSPSSTSSSSSSPSISALASPLESPTPSIGTDSNADPNIDSIGPKNEYNFPMGHLNCEEQLPDSQQQQLTQDDLIPTSAGSFLHSLCEIHPDHEMFHPAQLQPEHIHHFERSFFPQILRQQQISFPRHGTRMSSPTDIDVMGASVLGFTPGLREVFLMNGGADVSRNSLLLRITTNRSVLLIPGGQQEMPYSRHTDFNYHFHTGHLGFIKVALRTGTPLVPIISFGENQLFSTWQFPQLQMWIYRLTRVFLPMYPHGPGFAPIPFSSPITLAVGEPIFVPCFDTDDIPDDVVRYYHNLYLCHVARLFFESRESIPFAKNSTLTFVS